MEVSRGSCASGGGGGVGLGAGGKRVLRSLGPEDMGAWPGEETGRAHGTQGVGVGDGGHRGGDGGHRGGGGPGPEPRLLVRTRPFSEVQRGGLRSRTGPPRCRWLAFVQVVHFLRLRAELLGWCFHKSQLGF